MEAREFAINVAREAGAKIMELAGVDGGPKYSDKSKYDILAEADLESEKIILNGIKKYFPEHSILTEETGAINGDPEYLWVIDPIDGTINFSRGIDSYCISIGLEKNGKIEMGVIYQPVFDRLYVAERGRGAFLGNKKFAVSKEEKMINMILARCDSNDVDARRRGTEIYGNLSDKVRHSRMIGSSALMFAMLAAGQVDLYFKNSFYYWDYAAGIALIEEAGGVVTDFDGAPINRFSKNIAASNGRVHEEFLEALNR